MDRRTLTSCSPCAAACAALCVLSSRNKYNQTHYDKENPPPKIVQGYKFNLFYPDLIDPTVTPRYRIERSFNEKGEAEDDYCVLRFMAGPPYEDVAFKVVRKEWEYAPRRGFKCVFDKVSASAPRSLLCLPIAVVDCTHSDCLLLSLFVCDVQGVMMLWYNHKRIFYRR